MAGSFAIRQSKTILVRSYEAVVGFIDWLAQWAIHEDKDTTLFGMNVRMHGFAWSLGWVSAVDSEGRTLWIVDAHRDDGQRFVVHSDEILTAFLELEAAISKNSIDAVRH
jgi:hypothetical protein